MTGKSKVKINSEDFPVNPGSEFKLSDRPTDVTPISTDSRCKSCPGDSMQTSSE